MIRSHYVNEITEEMNGKEVTLAGWVHEVRETSKITFLILRDNTGLAQIIGKVGDVDAKIIKSMSLPKESVIKVTGIVKANKESKKGFEIIPKEITNLNPLSAKVPFEVTGKVPADIDVRLNNRFIDLRRLESAAIFGIESTIMNTFTSTLTKQGFRQIRTPAMIAEASEGGSDIFEIKYFDKKGYLAQSPQLYKQLAIIGGFDKVVMLVPAFRAEKSNTVYHLTECTQMDIEMAFADADDVIKILSNTVLAMIKAVKEQNKGELKTLGVELDVPEVKIVTYSDAIKKLQAKGHKIEYGHDFSREHEKGIQEVFGEAVVVKDYPTEVRAFYSMPKKDKPELSNSFDFIYKGFEICSGAQRIHDPDMLIESIKKRGMNPKNFEFYINAFRCGAPPHSGWSIGLERFTMCITNAKNIREVSLFPRDPKRLTP
ncbi:MAG: aspartate--tRNA(Asn) ligase [Candidatus Micrarchaeales archaeon]